MMKRRASTPALTNNNNNDNGAGEEKASDTDTFGTSSALNSSGDRAIIAISQDPNPMTGGTSSHRRTSPSASPSPDNPATQQQQHQLKGEEGQGGKVEASPGTTTASTPRGVGVIQFHQQQHQQLMAPNQDKGEAHA
jgi:hypothetical protein